MTMSDFDTSGFRSFKHTTLSSRSTSTRSTRSLDTCPSQRTVMIYFGLRDFGSLSHSTLEILRSDFPLLP
jgi:hypothetical protein